MSACDLRRLAKPSSADARTACCSTLVLDATCATSPHALPMYANGTGRDDALNRWCYTKARDRLNRETNKWLSAMSTRSKAYRPVSRGGRRRAWASQHKFYDEWLGCFGCTIPGDPSSCCSGRGSCVTGVCACHDGSFGVDCAGKHPAAASPFGAATAADAPVMSHTHQSLAIYVYESLPADLGAQSFALRTWISDLRGGFEVYSTEWRLLDYLLRDTFVRTLDPDNADLFFVPTLGSLGRMPGSEGNHRCTQPAHLELIVHHVRTQYPFWDRTGGRDHVFFLTGDQGACGLGQTGTKPIFITAWGLLGGPRKMEAFERFRDDFVDTNAIERNLTAGAWCHAPHKDVMVPPYGDVQFSDAVEPEVREPFQYSLLHVGGIWGAGNHGSRRISFYSQGMRQALYMRFGDERGRPFGIWMQNRSMRSELLAYKTKHSKFCLAPSGHGWGMRTGKNAVLGCVPLIAQPYVVQPYEMILPYEQFSRRIAFEEIPSVVRIVNVSDEEVHQMRQRLKRVRRAFMWRVEGGGTAYNHTILHLCHRALELRGYLKAGPSADCSPLAKGLPDASATQRMPKWFPAPLAAATLRLQAQRRADMVQLKQAIA